MRLFRNLFYISNSLITQLPKIWYSQKPNHQRVDLRDTYLDTLEEASVRHNITPFAKLFGGLVSQGTQKTSGLYL